MKILRRLHSGGVSTIDVLISYIDEGDNGATRFMPLWVLNTHRLARYALARPDRLGG